MNRTRLTFFIVLVVFLLILAGSVTRSLTSTALLPLYVGCSVFGLGVVALDFLGLLGHHGADDAAGGHGAGVHGAGGHGDAADAAGFHDLASHDASGGEGGSPWAHAAHIHGEGDHGAAHDGSHAHVEHAAEQDRGLAGKTGEAETAPSTAGHLPAQSQATVTHAGPDPTSVLSMLAYLRLFVYFCLGFGPAGWVALDFGRGAIASLAIAVPFGAASLYLARTFFRFQRRDTGMVPPETDMLSEQASVVVPCDDRNMGKVRVQAGMTVTDLYALAADRGASYASGDTVRIVRVAEDCVYVR